MRFFLLVLLTVVSFQCVNDKPKLTRSSSSAPAQPVATTPPPAFNGTRAFEYLVKQTSFGPRNPNSPGHRACLDYLAATLRQYADEVQLQPFTAQGYNEVLALTNIIARFNPQATSRILLCAHWDTRPRADNDTNVRRRDQPILGANDGASGVAVLLEIASLLKQHPPAIGVDIVLFDGEDYGSEGDLDKYFLGARYFSSTKPPDYNPRFGILLDLVGDAFLDLPKEYHSVQYAPDIIDLVWKKARELGYPQFIDAVGEAVNDDHVPLNQAGIKTINIIDFNYPDPTHRFWHSHNDTPEHCSAESLEAVGTVVMHVIYTQQP
ncbi:MAG: hypothetical protein C4326_15450 [Ignavibacteria bacterium]